jgi:ABC-type glycerol-3-phosphate transport system permease component
VEGATRTTAFLRIVLPMSRNVLVAAGLFAIGTIGNDFMLASIFLLNPQNQTVAAGLGVMDVSLEELTAVAGVNLAAIPVVILCAIFARTYVRGLTAAMLEGA